MHVKFSYLKDIYAVGFFLFVKNKTSQIQVIYNLSISVAC